MVWIVIITILIMADQLIKQLVLTALSGSSSIAVIENFFYLVNRRNTGAAWSFLANVSWGITVLTILSGIASIVLIVLTVLIKRPQFKAPLSLLTAGAAGNMIDRIRYAGVTDYMDLHFGTYIFPTFNLADTCLVIGTILLSWFLLSSPEDPAAVNRHQNYLS